MAGELLSELHAIQRLLAAPQQLPPPVPALPPPPALPSLPAACTATASSDDEVEDAEPRLAAPSPQPAPDAATMRQLRQEVAALRARAAEKDDQIRRLSDALAAAQQDGGLVAQRLQAQLAAKAEECSHLAELVFGLRSEGDALRDRLTASTQAAADAEHSTAASVAQLQEAAVEWRRQSEEAQEALADARSRCAALQAEVQRLQAERQGLERAVQEERAAREAAAAQAAGAAGSSHLVAALRERCAMERSWRKAVTQWLQGEMQTKADLERVLLNIGAAARIGSAGPGATGTAPQLPPRRMAASQLVPPAAVTVTVVHTSPGAAGLSAVGTTECDAGGVSGGQATSTSSGSGDWRAQYKKTMAAFEERHRHLQAELSGLRKEALQLPGGK